MMHNDRIWYVSEVESAEELAEKLSQETYCCCNAFKIEGHPEYAWLNDATSPDSAQEYAAIILHGQNDKPLQLESITFSWCNYDEALGYINRTLAGKDDMNDFVREIRPVLQTPEKHGRCHHCA